VIWNTDIDDFQFFGIDSIDAPNKGSTAGTRRANFPAGINTEARATHPIRPGGTGPVMLKVSWFPNSTGTGDVRWRVQYGFHSFGSVVVSPSNNIVHVQAAPGIQNQLMEQGFEIPDIFGSASGVMNLKIQRRGTHGDDTYTGTARMVGFCYRRNRIPKP
jgi:hypothetical protein